MQFLSKIIEFTRQHYEKILLCTALLALALTVFFIYEARIAEQRKIDEYLRGLDQKGKASIAPVDLGRLDEALRMAASNAPLDLSSPHNLLNPVKWVRQADGQLIKSVKGTEATLDLVQLTNLHPLLLTVAYDRYTAAGYTVAVTNEMQTGPAHRNIAAYKLNETNRMGLLILREVRGQPDDPTELVLNFKDGGEPVTLAKDRPYLRTNAFEVDLKYANNKPNLHQRIGATLNLGGEEYKIVAITATEVVFSAANDKKYTVSVNPRR